MDQHRAGSLSSPATGLVLTHPTEPVTGSINTFSIRASLSSRLDYVFPGGLLRSNLAASQVFRTELLVNPPPPLLPTDSADASDHLPVCMAFNNPYDRPFRLVAVEYLHPTITITWESVPGQTYHVEGSANLATWSSLAGDVLATAATSSFTTNVSGNLQFFRVSRRP